MHPFFLSLPKLALFPELSALSSLFQNESFCFVRRTFNFTITASEGFQAEPARARVVIELIDVNDNPPVFSSATYTFSVSENQQPPVQVGNVTAMDEDSGINAQVLLLQQSAGAIASKKCQEG